MKNLLFLFLSVFAFTFITKATVNTDFNVNSSIEQTDIKQITSPIDNTLDITKTDLCKIDTFFIKDIENSTFLVTAFKLSYPIKSISIYKDKYFIKPSLNIQEKDKLIKPFFCSTNDTINISKTIKHKGFIQKKNSNISTNNLGYTEVLFFVKPFEKGWSYQYKV